MTYQWYLLCEYQFTYKGSDCAMASYRILLRHSSFLPGRQTKSVRAREGKLRPYLPCLIYTIEYCGIRVDLNVSKFRKRKQATGVLYFN